MSPMADDDEDFGLSSSDEADIIALVDGPTHGTKRKHSLDEEIKPKREAIEVIDTIPLAIKTLKQCFGLQRLRLKQEQVISRILSGGSATVVFPTGGGKSLCYQLPALLFSEIDKLANVRGENDSGITLVVSPLIALMKDQVDGLVKRGIKAAVMDSTKTRAEYLETVDMLRNGKLKLLYCAPERLNNERFVQSIKYVRGGIRLVAVDEAHCISQWGHAFRPDYLKVSRFVQEIKAERVICLTATATARVAKDICDAFNIDKTGLFRTCTYRPNLRLLAESAVTKAEIYPRLFKFLRLNPGASIVYVTLQKQTKMLAEDLRDQGFNAKAFHAGMKTSSKTRIQEEFMEQDDLIIVATIAFGMGIDKSCIRNVVHFNIPSSIESYCQEIGRAGRDGKPSTCMFYICADDLYLREIFARGNLPSRESVRGLLEEVFSSETEQVPSGVLELQHGLIRETTPVYSDYSFKPGSSFPAISIADHSKAAIAIKVNAKQGKKLTSIDTGATTRKTKIPQADIIRKLNEWSKENAIKLETSGMQNVYKVLKPLSTSHEDIENLVTDIYDFMKMREREALDRNEAILGLITSTSCFNLALAKYFGDDLPDKNGCGHCTWCESHKAVLKPVLPPMPFNWFAFRRVLQKVKERDDARFLARVAFGIISPRVVEKGLVDHPVYASMNTHNFMDLLHAFTAECSKANQARR